MGEQKLTDIAELGEFGLIDHLTKDIKLTQKSTVTGVGDDAAVLKTGGRKYMLVSTDLLIEGVHFDMAYTPLKHLGYKSAIVNFSDMAAMNGMIHWKPWRNFMRVLKKLVNSTKLILSVET